MELQIYLLHCRYVQNRGDCRPTDISAAIQKERCLHSVGKIALKIFSSCQQSVERKKRGKLLSIDLGGDLSLDLQFVLEFVWIVSFFVCFYLIFAALFPPKFHFKILKFRISLKVISVQFLYFVDHLVIILVFLTFKSTSSKYHHNYGL